MRKAHKVALITMGSAMLITSGAAMAGPPTAYGDWTVSGGPISPNVTCPATFTCGAAITGDGFFQRQITDSTGTQYFQTIITPVGATATTATALSNLAFTDENFVQQAGGTGIADQQNVYAPSTVSNPGDFTSTTAINSGWAQGAGENAIDLAQTVDDSAAQAPFTLAFTLTDSSTNNSAPVVGINEQVSLYSPGNPNSDPNDKQTFYLKQLKATSASSEVLDGATDATGAGVLDTSVTPNTGTIAWGNGDLIQAMWMGQVVTSGTSGGAQAFGVQTYTNVDGGGVTANIGSVTLVDQSAIGSAGAGATGPGAWWDSTVFGTAPTF
ncbi:MAG: hypothetical protein P8079_03525 [Gammaproteobacteria bacterium]